MNQCLLSTPTTRNDMKQLCSTASNDPQQDCPYCQMKKKFNIGTNGEQKCFQHSIKLKFQSESSCENESSCSKKSFLKAHQLVEILEDVQSSLDYYWDHLRQISGGNPNQVHKDLQPVLNSVKRIQQKIGKFFYDSAIDVSQIKPISTQTSMNKKFVSSGSEKFLRIDLSHLLDPDQGNETQSIKQWVMHFHKIIQMRRLPENIEPLPFQQELQMRIFKQSMERKFMQFVQQIKDYQKKVKNVLSKLIFYMEKSSSNDILFIEGQNLDPDTRQAQLERMLLLQASSVQYMIGSKNMN